MMTRLTLAVLLLATAAGVSAAPPTRRWKSIHEKTTCQAVAPGSCIGEYGLTINATTGALTGSPTAIGVFNVVAAVSDGVNSTTVNFTWTVTGAPPFTLNVPAPPAPLASGGTASFTASANGGTNTLFKWNFGDGSPETAYSASPSATHTYTQAGLYYVTVTAVDDSAAPQQQTVLQAVHLPLAAGRPGISSNIAVAQPASGNPRVWVVNQDNDTVSAFDAVTRNRLAEIAVGAAPRALAVAPNGMVWVTNKQGDSISVIDPASLSVSRTLALPLRCASTLVPGAIPSLVHGRNFGSLISTV